MASLHKRLDMWSTSKLAHGTPYAKAYTLADEVRIECGGHALHLTPLEANKLIGQLESSLARLIRINGETS